MNVRLATTTCRGDMRDPREARCTVFTPSCILHFKSYERADKKLNSNISPLEPTHSGVDVDMALYNNFYNENISAILNEDN